MSMHLRNSRDLMVSEEFDQHTFGKLRHVTDTETASRTSSVDTEYGGWWTSKTSLEQKLIVLSSLLFILSFCLVISVIVINNRKPAKGEVTTVAPTVTTSVEPGSSISGGSGSSGPTEEPTSPITTDEPSSPGSTSESNSPGSSSEPSSPGSTAETQAAEESENKETDAKLNSEKRNSPSKEENVRTAKNRSLHVLNFLGIPMQKRKALLFGVGL